MSQISHDVNPAAALAANPRPGRDPDLEPVPVTGCDICAALAGQREAARAEGRMDTVRSCNRELLNHPRAQAASR